MADMSWGTLPLAIVSSDDIPARGRQLPFFVLDDDRFGSRRPLTIWLLRMSEFMLSALADSKAPMSAVLAVVFARQWSPSSLVR